MLFLVCLWLFNTLELHFASVMDSGVFLWSQRQIETHLSEVTGAHYTNTTQQEGTSTDLGQEDARLASL